MSSVAERGPVDGGTTGALSITRRERERGRVDLVDLVLGVPVPLTLTQRGSHRQCRRNDATELAHADMTTLPQGGHQLHRTVSDANNNW